MKEQPWGVPAHLIKKEFIDFENEALSMLGASVAVGRKLLSKPISLGVMSLVEIMDNSLIKLMFTVDKNAEPERSDLDAFFYINHHRKNALEDVRAWYRGDKEPLNKKIKEFGKEFAIKDNDVVYVVEMIKRANLGFKMIPNSNSQSTPMVYGAEALAGVSYSCCAKLGITYDELIWDTPITFVGHIIALNAIENGTKNVERPHDVEHLKELKKICAECDENEELYPWQKDKPFKIGIFKWQTENALKKWSDAANEYMTKNSKDTKATANEIKRVKSMHKSLHAEYLKELAKNG